MDTRRIGKWVIVLFLLAALPGLTAVMAQEQEPAAQTPVVAEVGVSAAIPWVNTESEPNNGMGTAEGLQSVHGGVIGCGGDVDYYQIEAMNYSSQPIGIEVDTNSPILIDIEAYSIGSPLAVDIFLYADDGVLVDSATYSSATDPLLYHNLEAWRTYYLAVQGHGSGCGPNYTYQVLVSDPLLISAAAGKLGKASVAGIPFQAVDVLAWSNFVVDSTTYEKWNMLLDLSDLGVKVNLTNLAGAWRNSDFLLLGFAANVTLPGISEVVKPWDVVLFDPSQVGPNTAGTFQLWWRGSDHQLTTAAEKLDAIDWPNWSGAAGLYASTTGTASLTKSGGGVLKLADEDIGLWGTQNVWVNYFDHSVVAGMGAEDVIALSVSDEYWTYDMTWQVRYHLYNVVVLGSTVCGPSVATQKDIVRTEEYWDYFWEEETYGIEGCARMWRGPDHGWNYNIDAIEFHSQP